MSQWLSQGYRNKLGGKTGPLSCNQVCVSQTGIRTTIPEIQETSQKKAVGFSSQIESESAFKLEDFIILCTDQSRKVKTSNKILRMIIIFKVTINVM